MKLLIIFSLFVSLDCLAGHLSAEYQHDSRKFNTINFTGFSKLPHEFSVWGFVDFEGAKNSEVQQSDASTHFLEIDLRSPTLYDIGLTTELNSATGSGNDLMRAGLFYKPSFEWIKKHKLFLFFKIFPYESDEEGGQASMAWAYSIPDFLEDRISFSGFWDWNFKSGSAKKTHLVSETQMRVLLVERLSLLLEYRYNSFLSTDKEGLGVGLHYQF